MKKWSEKLNRIQLLSYNVVETGGTIGNCLRQKLCTGAGHKITSELSQLLLPSVAWTGTLGD